METEEIIDVLQVRCSLIRISHGITEHNHGVEDIVLVSIKTRGEILARQLTDIIYSVEDISVPCFTLNVSHWRDGREKPYSLPMESPPVKDRKVILTDDALFKGRVARAAIDAVIHYDGAREIRLAVLVDRRHRELSIRTDYIGKNIPSSLREVIRARANEVNGNDDASISR